MQPAADGEVRDRLMFRAGQVHASRQLTAWRVSSGALALILVGGVAMNVRTPAHDRNHSRLVQESHGPRVVYVLEASGGPAPRAGDTSYSAYRTRLSGGQAETFAFPAPAEGRLLRSNTNTTTTPGSTYRELLRNL